MKQFAGVSMRLIFTIGLAVVLCYATSNFALAGKCPANATEASRVIWRDRSIPHDQMRSAVHPCGKRITCSGGSSTRNTKRSCSWG
jgi:hypothetical protein